MIPNFRFAVVSDLHIALPHTIWDHPSRFHLVEVSIPAFESVLEHLTQIDLDFILLPGDLTQHGEPDNHNWLQERLAKLPFPAYVIPGNHDVPVVEANSQSIAAKDFPKYYRKFGYDNDELYYTRSILPGVRLVALNSNTYDEQGNVKGRLCEQQLQWLEKVLSQTKNELVLVMIHHNVVEHLPNQSRHPIANRYMLENASELLKVLQRYQVKLVFTGHLHVQDIAEENGVYDITTGSLVSYPHPYRVFEYRRDELGNNRLQILSYRVESLLEYPNLQSYSRAWMGDRSFPFLVKLLTLPPLSLPVSKAEELAPIYRDFWASIAEGDAIFDYPEWTNEVNNYFNTYAAVTKDGYPALIDNNISLFL
jgi:3',5'-cyclic AMP phosphodiesterase CpdA